MHRISVYLTEHDYSNLEKLRADIDPLGLHSRSRLISIMITVLLHMFNNGPEDIEKWREAVKRERSIADFEASQEKE